MRRLFDRLITDGILFKDPDPPPAGDPPKTDPPTADPPKADPPAADVVTMPKAEADALRRDVAQLRRDAKKRDDEAAAAEQKRLQEEGQFKELAETEKTRADRLQAELDTSKQNARVARLAAERNFQDPSDVLPHLTAEERADDSLAGDALDRLADSKPYLLQQQAPADPPPTIGKVVEAGKPTPKPGEQPAAEPAPTVTREQLKGMTAQQIAALPQESVTAALAAPVT